MRCGFVFYFQLFFWILLILGFFASLAGNQLWSFLAHLNAALRFDPEFLKALPGIILSLLAWYLAVRALNNPSFSQVLMQNFGERILSRARKINVGNQLILDLDEEKAATVATVLESIERQPAETTGSAASDPGNLSDDLISPPDEHKGSDVALIPPDPHLDGVADFAAYEFELWEQKNIMSAAILSALSSPAVILLCFIATSFRREPELKQQFELLFGESKWHACIHQLVQFKLVAKVASANPPSYLLTPKAYKFVHSIEHFSIWQSALKVAEQAKLLTKEMNSFQ
jgi:hypothetical protein